MTRTTEGKQIFRPDAWGTTRGDFLLAGAAALLLGGCSDRGTESPSSDGTRPFKHAAGTTKVPDSPRRVAALHDTSVTYPLLDLGLEPVASTGEGEIRAGENDVSDLEFLGTSADPNLERLAALGPDLIVGLLANSSGQYERLSEIAPTVLLDSEISVFDYHRMLAELVDRLPEYESLVSEAERRMRDLRGRLEPILPGLEVSALSALSADEIFTYYGPGNAYSVAFERLGLRFPADMPPSYDEAERFYSLERLPDFDADAIFLMSNAAVKEGVNGLEEQEIFRSLNAAQKGQVFTVDYDEWTYARVPSILSVCDDVEHHLLDSEIDTSGDFRSPPGGKVLSLKGARRLGRP